MKKVVVMLMMAALVAAAQAVVIVDFNPGLSTTGGRGADTHTLLGDTWDFSDTTALVGSGGGQNDVIYGGVISTWSAEQEYNPNLRHISYGGGGFEVQNNPGTSSSTSLTGVYVWNKADFLAGSTDAVGFTAGDSVSLNFSWMTLYNQDLRMVIKQGGSYYVSSWYTTGSSASGIDPTWYSWAELNTVDYTWGAFAPLTLDNIEAVGLYYTIDRDPASLGQTAARLADFQVNATVVPEPATMALLGLGGLLLRRRK